MNLLEISSITRAVCAPCSPVRPRSSRSPSSYNEVLGVNWNWVDRVVYDNVQYIHGEGGTARTKCRADLMSTVQGHLHSQAYTEWYVGANFKVFGMQVGCGIDHDSYAMAYAKRGKKPAIGCGVVIGGHTAINILMDNEIRNTAGFR